ncbi:MAG TPA: OmpA family protein [Gemmatimonadales bacterium]|nr:OmpA family protein [Gemmatimonadales bacterium]
MVRNTVARRIPVATAVLIGALGVAGCAAKVTRKDFDAEMVKIREEMQASDRQLGSRVDSVSQLTADHQRRLDALEQELQSLRKEYNVSIERLQGMLKFNVPVHFDFDRAELRESDRPVLDRFSAVAREYYPEAVITVEGFADPAGDAAYNRRLGKRRGETVREYLAGAGQLGADRLRVVSYGEARERQVVPGAERDQGLPNRRVALVIDYAGTGSGEVAMP